MTNTPYSVPFGAPVYVGVDTGNRQYKTRNNIFVAGIEPISDNETLYEQTWKVDGQRYALTRHRNPYEIDKTVNGNCFALTVYAVEQELAKRGIDTSKGPVPVKLCLSLPPRDFSRLRQKFHDYFARPVPVEYNCLTPANRQFEIVGVNVYPQGFAAIWTRFADIQRLKRALIVDIGGYTTDVIELHEGSIDPNLCTSLDMGMIKLYTNAIQRIQSTLGYKLTEDDVDEILATNAGPNPQITEIVRDEAKKFVHEIAAKLYELGADLRIIKGVFVGGGTVRLQPYIAAESDVIANPIIISDIHANAIGCEELAMAYDREAMRGGG